jgi:hypothetical protein
VSSARCLEVIHRVVVNPAKHRGGNRFDPGRVDIRWHWESFVRASDAQWEHMSEDERQQAIREADEELQAIQAVEGVY